MINCFLHLICGRKYLGGEGWPSISSVGTFYWEPRTNRRFFPHNFFLFLKPCCKGHLKLFLCINEVQSQILRKHCSQNPRSQEFPKPLWLKLIQSSASAFWKYFLTSKFQESFRVHLFDSCASISFGTLSMFKFIFGNRKNLGQYNWLNVF